jgi:ubiquinone/menaquinone biosynthesis C-methylase UbiE
MNENHQPISEFAFKCVDVGTNDRILDIGCGGGVNIEKFLKLTDNNVDGIDYSDVSVKESAKRNQKAIGDKRCRIIQADVSKMPIDDEVYDLVSAFETIYFWPGLEKCFAEVAKVLKPGGYFMISNESDGTDPTSLKFEKIIDGMKNHTAEEIEKALKAAGFSEVRCYHHSSKPWITVLAKK